MPSDDERPTVPRIVIEPFDPGRHDRSDFSCGTKRLDNFLRLSARKQQKDDFTRVFVAVVDPVLDGQNVAPRPASLVDERGGVRPACVVEHGFVE